MADFEYVDVNGRQIRVRPRETAQEIDEYGNFHRQPNRFTEGFGEGKNPVEKDRYILFWAKGCNWSNRAAIARELLGLEDAVKVEIVDWTDREENLGWEFVNSPDHINPETGAQFLSELYYNADEEYTGRTTVPAFVDYKTKKVVNNDYHWLTNHLETAFRPFHAVGRIGLNQANLESILQAFANVRVAVDDCIRGQPCVQFLLIVFLDVLWVLFQVLKRELFVLEIWDDAAFDGCAVGSIRCDFHAVLHHIQPFQQKIRKQNRGFIRAGIDLRHDVFFDPFQIDRILKSRNDDLMVHQQLICSRFVLLTLMAVETLQVSGRHL